MIPQKTEQHEGLYLPLTTLFDRVVKGRLYGFFLHDEGVFATCANRASAVSARNRLCWLLGTSVQKRGGKEEEQIGMASTRVNGQFSISSCLILLASQMGREEKALE